MLIVAFVSCFRLSPLATAVKNLVKEIKSVLCHRLSEFVTGVMCLFPHCHREGAVRESLSEYVISKGMRQQRTDEGLGKANSEKRTKGKKFPQAY